MPRPSLLIREAAPSDAAALAQLWSPILRAGDLAEQAQDMALVIERTQDRPDERLVVAEIGAQVVGATFLRATTVTPLNLEPAVQIVSPHVLAKFQRHGVGRALMEAGVSWAEELGIGHVASAAAAGSRDANRFMARLSMGPQAMLRLAPTHLVRARLNVRGLRPASTGQQRPINSVLAARRLSRRSRAAAS